MILGQNLLKVVLQCWPNKKRKIISMAPAQALPEDDTMKGYIVMDWWRDYMVPWHYLCHQVGGPCSFIR